MIKSYKMAATQMRPNNNPPTVVIAAAPSKTEVVDGPADGAAGVLTGIVALVVVVEFPVIFHGTTEVMLDVIVGILPVTMFDDTEVV